MLEKTLKLFAQLSRRAARLVHALEPIFARRLSPHDAAAFGAVLLALALTGCNSGGGKKPNVADDSFDFSPIWRGGSAPGDPAGFPLPPHNLKAASTDGVVSLTWDMPKIYKTNGLKIGYRIFRKKAPNEEEATNWDFSSVVGLDWQLDVGEVVKANDCTDGGLCTFTDPVGGPMVVSYAVIAHWNIEDYHSNRSVHVVAVTTTSGVPVDYSFPEGFMNSRPRYVIGTVVPDTDRRADANIYNYRTSTAPWFLLDGKQSQATRYSWVHLANPITVGFSSDGLSALLPDSGYYRAMYLTRGKEDECDAFTEQFLGLCHSILLSRNLISDYAIGQKSNTLGFDFATNALQDSRKFRSRATSVQKGASGTRYYFVADEQRILVRSDDIFPCFADPGEVGDKQTGLGVSGLCGFQWSIGTNSPRQRCARHVDGTKVAGEVACTDAELAYGLADSTPPTNYSLRMPGAPIIVGENLYIPDAGNARLVRLPNFEKAIKSCGQLLPAGSTVKNGPCTFDQVIGQYATTPEDPEKFNVRTCLRGGERGGMDGTTAVGQSEAFRDPIIVNCIQDPDHPACDSAVGACKVGGTFPMCSGTGSGGAACRLDMLTDSTSGTPVVRRSRQAGDFKDEGASMMSPDTGLLAGITERLFRAPVQIVQDPTTHFIYVMDSGFTMAESAASADTAQLPPRIMVWQRDPFTFQKCVPVDPKANPPSCSVDQNNVCTGTGCVDRQCEAAECNASYLFGQLSALFGFAYQSGQTLGVDVNPSGYYPLTAFDVGYVGGQKGLWAVGGKDGTVLHWNEINQTAIPDVHNKMADDNIDPTFRLLNFNGINVDPNTGEIITWDSKLQVGIVWIGKSKVAAKK